MNKIRLMLAVLLSVASMASLAHTRLVESLPADGAVLERSPGSVALKFSAAVRIVRLRLVDGSGSAIEPIGPDSRGPASDFKIALPALPSGDYVLDWSVMGQDTHKVSGLLRFTLRAGQ